MKDQTPKWCRTKGSYYQMDWESDEVFWDGIHRVEMLSLLARMGIVW